MASKNKPFSIKEHFSPISTQQWEEVIKQDLKGADYSKKLIWCPIEGIEVRPYYRSEDLKGLPSMVSPNPEGNDWLVRDDIYVHTTDSTNMEAKEAIERGCQSLGFVLPVSFEPKPESFAKLLEGVNPEEVEVNLLIENSAIDTLKAYTDFLSQRRVDLQTIKGSVVCSPLNAISRKGNFCKDKATAKSTMANVAALGERTPNLTLFGVGGDIFHNAGASAVQELAFSLAMGAEYMDWLTDSNVDAHRAASTIKFTLAVGTNYFMEIAKLRAARHLWGKVQEANGIPLDKYAPALIHAVTGSWSMAMYDPHVNMLRTTTAGMSAILGGAHSLTVQPFDAAFRKPSPLSKRIARNQQLVLREEAYLNRVADPAAGSYFIESLTASIAQSAWTLFLEVEECGGYTQAFADGFIQKHIGDISTKRLSGIASRRETMVGINQFPNAQEQTPTLEALVQSEANDQASGNKGMEFEPLQSIRASQQIEGVRLATEQGGVKPTVFMLTLGNLTMRRARAQFACNFFGCAGFEVIDNIGFDSIEQGVEAAVKANASIVVLCSSDDEYPDLAPKVYPKLPSGAELVIAGNPPCREDLERIGIKKFIHVKSNLLD